MSEKRSSAAFALSLVGGVLIIFGSLLPLLFFANFQISPMRGKMGGMMGWWEGSGFMGGWFFPLTLIAGVLVLVGAILMNARPQETTTWGIIVLIFSIIGFTGMGFSILGAIIGIIGGIIALSERSSK
ncbi:MAG TPA: hypothetical protein VF884_12685 [Nitrososphaeraceae archaeon]